MANRSNVATVPLVFTTQLWTLSLWADTEHDGQLQTVVITLGGETILSTSMVLHWGKATVLDNFDDLLRDWAITEPSKLAVKVGADDTGYCWVLPCRTRLPLVAWEWIKQRPLTLADPEVPTTTTSDSVDYLTFVADGDAESVMVRLYDAGAYDDGTEQAVTELKAVKGTTFTTKENTSTYPARTLTVYTCTLDWRKLRAAGTLADPSAEVVVSFAQTAPYAITCYRRYRFIPRPEGAVELTYTGCFGEQETQLFTAVTEKHKPTRSAVTIAGKYTNYLIEPGTTFEGVTPLLTDTDLTLCTDLLEARTVTRVSDGVALALTDGSLEADGTPDAQTRLKLTWREATKLPQRVKLPAKTFDSTFDDTFQ